jgi:hypothetical protein
MGGLLNFRMRMACVPESPRFSTLQLVLQSEIGERGGGGPPPEW